MHTLLYTQVPKLPDHKKARLSVSGGGGLVNYTEVYKVGDAALRGSRGVTSAATGRGSIKEVYTINIPVQ
jgi:hypothetical protein